MRNLTVVEEELTHDPKKAMDELVQQALYRFKDYVKKHNVKRLVKIPAFEVVVDTDTMTVEK